MKFVVSLVVLFAFSILQPVLAEDEDKVWTSEVEIGAVVTTGNTKNQSFKLASKASRDSVLFRHSAAFDVFRSSEDGVVSAEKLYTFYQGDYKLEGDHSLFGRLSYEDDRFSGFDYQTNLTVGYSRLLLSRPGHTLRGDLGAGVRHSAFVAGGSNTEFITRLAGAYEWQISETSRFTQALSTEIGGDSVITRSSSAITAAIATSLAMKFAVNIKHQSDVPIGRKKTDTESSLTLVYSF